MQNIAMKYIGAHVSAAGGVENAPLRADKIGAKAIQGKAYLPGKDEENLDNEK